MTESGEVRPEILWHYTTQAALVGILDSKAFYASDVRFMNDHMELKYAIGLLPEVLDSIPEFAGFMTNSDGGVRAIAMLRQWLDEPEFNRGTYAVSVSEERDSLSQWRAYSGDATGYALGFDKARLTARMQNAAWPVALAQCEYGREQQLARLRNAMLDLLSAGHWQRYLDRGQKIGPGFPSNFQRCFMKAAPWLKDPAFSSEKEWRIASVSSHFGQQTTFGVREGREFLVPYLYLPLTDLGLCEVLVGPNSHPDNAQTAAQLLLAHHGVSSHVKVTRSAIPYRRV